MEGCERCRSEMRWLSPAVRVLPEGVERLQAPPALRRRVMIEVRADAHAADVEARPVEGGFRHRVAGWLSGLGSGSPGWRPIAGLAAVAAVILAVAAVAGYKLGSEGSGGSGGTSTIVAGHAPGVTAKMVREGDGGTLRLAHVHRLPSDRVLEAWVRREGRVEAVAALFVPDREGHASTTIADMKGVDAVMVTAEPTGGSEEPTSAPLITIPVPQ
ncbi:MAG: anti-sigma factor [Solirubrobacterales bacterium]